MCVNLCVFVQSITKCCDFILSKQKDDGGWGESYLSCEKKVGVHVCVCTRFACFHTCTGLFLACRSMSARPSMLIIVCVHARCDHVSVCVCVCVSETY